MYTALQDIKIDKIDFQWIRTTTKLSHLKRAIRVIELDGDYYKQLKDACYQRIQQIDPTQRRIAVSNAVSEEFRKEIENQLLDWEMTLQAKQNTKQKGQTTQEQLKDYQAYFTNDEKLNDNQRRHKMAQSERIKGNQAIKSKDFQQAITYYTVSISYDPQMHQSYSNRALAYLKTKQFQKCIQDCESALNIDNKHIKAYHRKAKALMGLNKKVQAYRVLQHGQRIEPDNIDLTKEIKELREEMTPEEIKELDSHLIPKSEFKKITIEEDSEEDN